MPVRVPAMRVMVCAMLAVAATVAMASIFWMSLTTVAVIFAFWDQASPTDGCASSFAGCRRQHTTQLIGWTMSTP